MARTRLRIYYGPPEDDAALALASSQNVRETVSVPLREIFSALADAVHNEKTWLRDFEDEEVTISCDLYEVLLAYQHFQRPSA
jgi:hypothetical protein